MKKLLDANAIIRFLLNDNEEMAVQTENVIKNGAFTIEVLKKAMETFSTYSLDFVDCLLIAYNNVLDIDVFSFDKKLNNKLKHS